jgi:hypothetical protein
LAAELLYVHRQLYSSQEQRQQWDRKPTPTPEPVCVRIQPHLANFVVESDDATIDDATHYATMDFID